MCRKVQCNNCKLARYEGCGRHIDAALQGIAVADRCKNWQRFPPAPCGAPAKPMREAIAELHVSSAPVLEKIQRMVLLLDTYEVTDEVTRQAYIDAISE